MAWSFAPSPIRIAVATIGLLGATLVGTAGAQVSVPGNYGTIQAAINAVTSGSLPDGTTIDVQPGTYFEALSVANTGRSMTVRGVGGPGATVVDAGGRNAPALYVLRATGLRRLNEAGIPTTLRDTRGKEIDGACGQLATTEDDEAVAAVTPLEV